MGLLTLQAGSVLTGTAIGSTASGATNTLDLQGAGSASNVFENFSAIDIESGAAWTLYLTDAETSVFGGGDTLYLSGAAGNQASLYNTSGSWDAVSGSNGTIYLTNAQASVSGGGDLINLLGSGSENTVSLYDTAGDWDTIVGVDGSSGEIYFTSAQATDNGSNDLLYLSGSSAATLTTSSDALILPQGIGGRDVVSGFRASDTMQFSHLDFASWSVLQGDMTQSGANTFISLDANNTVTLDAVVVTSLTASQFRFV